MFDSNNILDSVQVFIVSTSRFSAIINLTKENKSCPHVESGEKVKMANVPLPHPHTSCRAFIEELLTINEINVLSPCPACASFSHHCLVTSHPRRETLAASAPQPTGLEFIFLVTSHLIFNL